MLREINTSQLFFLYVLHFSRLSKSMYRKKEILMDCQQCTCEKISETNQSYITYQKYQKLDSINIYMSHIHIINIKLDQPSKTLSKRDGSCKKNQSNQPFFSPSGYQPSHFAANLCKERLGQRIKWHTCHGGHPCSWIISPCQKTSVKNHRRWMSLVKVGLVFFNYLGRF